MSTTFTPGADRQIQTSSKIPDCILIDPRAVHRFSLAVGEVLNRVEQDDALALKIKRRP
ncbi:hypothetical protein [Candidatus Berkiella aquae]|uniref:Uncharacterized protein n=1 Tax=Candidatus Berkiella aquae TaxID=295108 RepID=A0A0Q9YQ89_9GAMM|nr:hypothetical protein [Candidatus Berkiella aquae]MCS5711761.1 hypothetical protein [Candidatus Berkiella aquae]